MTRARAGVATVVLGVPLAATLLVSADPPAQPPPGPFPAEVYRERRERVMKELGGGIAVLHARGEEDRDGYRQDSDFHYLTGIDEAGAVLVLAPAERLHRHRLYLAPRDPEAERWTGEREPLGHALRERTGFDRVRRSGSLGGELAGLVQAGDTLHVVNRPSGPDSPLPPEQELYAKLQARIPGLTVKNQMRLLPALRAVKEPRELERMRVAIDATLAAHRAAARTIRPGVEENWIESVIATEFKKAGAVRPAFGSIVGAGDNSTILHYPDHDETIEPGALVVVDIGADYGRYAADVTRTYPADGTFTARQREVYDAVLRTQEACIRMVRPGVYMEDLHAEAERILRAAGFGDYFIHGLGHYVGLDVHDAGLRREPLAEGMVITVEPGVYIPEEALGVRIEDEVLVTAKGSELLTAELPRSADEIERMMAAERPSE